MGFVPASGGSEPQALEEPVVGPRPADAGDGFTTNLNLILPKVNDPSGENEWGDKLNWNFEQIDAGLPQDFLTDAPADGHLWARKDHAWETFDVDVSWSEIVDVPLTFPPTLPIPSSGVTGLDTKQTAQDEQIVANAAAVTALTTTVNGKLDTTTAAATYEPKIAPGTVDQFWRGDKVWSPLSSITVDAYTKAQSDAKYEPIDTMYTKAESDARYEPFDSAYTKAESDARYEPPIAPGNAAYVWYGDKTWKPTAPFPEAPTTGLIYGRRGQDASWQPVVGGVTISDTPPASPLPGQLWLESDSGALFARWDDGSGSPSVQWVQVNAQATITPSFLFMPAGITFDYWGPTEPPGAIFAYGQAVSRTTYAALFAVLGTTFGAGNGTTTFNLPDLRGRVVAGKDNMGGTTAGQLTAAYFGTDPKVLGNLGGVQYHQLTNAQLPNPISSTIGIGGATGSTFTALASGTSGVGAMNNTGGNTPHNNVQPTIIANKIMTTGGV